MSARGWWALGLWGALACGCSREFPPPSRVDGPRVLAVVTDPPSGPAGTHVRLRAALAGFVREPAVRWWWCAPGAGTDLSGGTVGPSEDCLEGGASPVEVGSGAAAAFDVPADYLLRVAEALAGVDAGAGDAGVPERVPLVLLVSADDGSGPARAVKRFGVTLDGSTGSNPEDPVLRVRAGGEEWVLRGGADGRCVAERGSVVVGAGADVSVELEGRAEDCWLYADDGVVREGGGCGGFVWRAPGKSGPVGQWFVLGDGQGGAAYCAWKVDVR